MKFAREIKIGLLFLAAVAVFIWGLNFIKGTNLFSDNLRLYAVYQRVDGLEKANKVVVNGLRIGQVQNMRFLPGTTEILVELYINNDIRIPRDSKARIVGTDLLGGKAVEIIMSNSADFVRNGDTLIAEIESTLKEQVNAQVEPLKRKAIALINSVDTVMTSIQSVFNENTRHNLVNSIENIQNTIRNIENASARIDTLLMKEQGRIRTIMRNFESITDNLQKNNSNITTIFTNFAAISDSLREANITQTFREAGLAINNLKEISDKINRGEGTIGKLFTSDSLYINLEKSTESLNKLLEDIRLNPKKYVKFSLF